MADDLTRRGFFGLLAGLALMKVSRPLRWRYPQQFVVASVWLSDDFSQQPEPTITTTHWGTSTLRVGDVVEFKGRFV